MPGLDPNAIHVINGDSAADTLKQAIHSANRTIVSRDVLSVGHVLPCADLEAWKQARVGFWREVLAHDHKVDLRPAQNDIWENQHRLLNATRIYAWTASGNTDQLCIAFLLELLERLGSDPARVELVEFHQVPVTGRRLIQMGELDVTQMRMHPPPHELSMDEWMGYRNAWRALSSSDPRAVETFGVANPQASPQLRQAMAHVLRRYPSASGLDHWDRMLLQAVRHSGPRAARAIAHAMGMHFDEGDLVGDSYFFRRLLCMASAELERPLLWMSGEGSTLQGTNFELTEFGTAVNEGKACAWPANPIDYWAGGVHVSSAAGNLWFNEGGVLRRG